MIQPGQIYRSCDPRESIRIRITAYRPGDARAHVVDAVTGKRFRQILVQQLHESPVTATGRRRRTGYVLDSQAPAGEAPEGPQERPEGGSATPRPPETANGAQAGAQRLTVFERVTPTEHCGDLMPAWVAGPRSECVLRPGHSGSHADDRGARWWCQTEGIDWRQRALDAEATVARVRAARERIGRANAREVDAIYCLDLIEEALDPPAHNAGPTVAEAAAEDRAYWEQRDAEPRP
jgi:hypothetical protein